MTRTRVALVALVKLVLVGLAVYPQLSARATGEEYRLAVGAYDPIDPQRGAYVDLSYPALRRGGDEQEGDIYVVLRQDDELWTSQEFTRTRPEAPTSRATTAGGRSTAGSRAGTCRRTGPKRCPTVSGGSAQSPPSASTRAATRRWWTSTWSAPRNRRDDRDLGAVGRLGLEVVEEADVVVADVDVDEPA
jgi:hypothetical protein